MLKGRAMRKPVLGLTAIVLALLLALVIGVICLVDASPAAAEPTPTITATPTPSPSPTATASATATATASPTPTATATVAATPTPEVDVWVDFVDAPGMNVTLEVTEDTQFAVRINISYVDRLKIAQYDVSYDPDTIIVVKVAGQPTVETGRIGGLNFPVYLTAFQPAGTQGVLRIVNWVDPSGLGSRTGSGYLSKIYFRSVGMPCNTSFINVDVETLDDVTLTKHYRADVTNSSVHIFAPTPSPSPTSSPTATASPSATPTPSPTATPTVFLGDANEDGVIDAGDITKVERIIAAVDAPTENADANVDGAVNATDMGVIEYIILDLWPWNHVHIEAPDNLPYCTNFTADIFVTYVENFCNYSVMVDYNTSVLDVNAVTNGTMQEIAPGVSASFYTVDITHWDPNYNNSGLLIYGHIPGCWGGPGVDGAGRMARIEFHVNGSAGQTSPLNFNQSYSFLMDSSFGLIATTWGDDSFTVAP
jgi:cytoskeletal protein RodZ